MSWGNAGINFWGNKSGGPLAEIELVYDAGAPGPEKDKGSLFGKLLDTGIGVTNTILGYKLQSQQIKHGQFPTVGYDENGRPVPVTATTAAAAVGGAPGLFNFGSLFWILLIAGAFFLLRR